MKHQYLDFITVDVSHLAPPEPMTVILNHLAKLNQQECLLVKHRRQPFPLYEKLTSAGFLYYCEVHTLHNIDLYIFYQQDQHLFNEFLEDKNISKGGC